VNINRHFRFGHPRATSPWKSTIRNATVQLNPPDSHSPIIPFIRTYRVPIAPVKSEKNIYGMVESIICEMGGGNPSIKVGRVCVLAILFLFLSIASFSQTAATPGLGSVEGVLLDRDSIPISGATVYALLKEDMRITAASTTSDSAGKFTLRELPAGGVFVYAYKESDGYPKAFFQFFTNPGSQLPVEAKVESGKLTTGVTLKLGARSAYLKFNLTDENGNHVPAAVVFTRLDQDGDFQTGTKGDDTILVPPVPFRLTIQASGYPPWHYGRVNYAGKTGLIALKPGQTLNLNVRLHKK
jgi:Carboxypeptidase regulatory-like domain